jgi:microcystin-dependent protein
MTEAEQVGVETGRGVGASLRREVALLRAQLDDVQEQLDMAQDKSLRPEEVYHTGHDAEVPAGVSMEWWGGDTIPPGWLLCDGSAVSRLQYARLFRAIGTAYGEGDESTTFNLPNCADRLPVMSTFFCAGGWQTNIEDREDKRYKHSGGSKEHLHGHNHDHAIDHEHSYGTAIGSAQFALDNRYSGWSGEPKEAGDPAHPDMLHTHNAVAMSPYIARAEIIKT